MVSGAGAQHDGGHQGVQSRGAGAGEKQVARRCKQSSGCVVTYVCVVSAARGQQSSVWGAREGAKGTMASTPAAPLALRAWRRHFCYPCSRLRHAASAAGSPPGATTAQRAGPTVLAAAAAGCCRRGKQPAATAVAAASRALGLAGCRPALEAVHLHLVLLAQLVVQQEGGHLRVGGREAGKGAG